MDLSLHAVNTDSSETSGATPITAHTLVQHIFSTTSCYDLMQASSKGTIFETTIPFQLAFFALIEHDTDVAPLWDPELRSFVGLMVVQDYITAMRLCLAHNIAQASLSTPSSPNGNMAVTNTSSSNNLQQQQQNNNNSNSSSSSSSSSSASGRMMVSALELTSKPIADILLAMPGLFANEGFPSLEVDDSALQIFSLLRKTRNDYVPITDPDGSSLVSILGVQDLIHLLGQIAKNNISLFNQPLSSFSTVGTYQNILSMTKAASIFDALQLLHQHHLSALPVVDELGRIQGSYHKSDVSFIMKAQDPEGVLHNLRSFKLEHSLILKEQLLATGELISNTQSCVTAKAGDSLLSVLNSLEMNRTNRVFVIDDNRVVKGVVTAKDILNYYLDSLLTPR
eukprot:gene6272-6914_t